MRWLVLLAAIGCSTPAVKETSDTGPPAEDTDTTTTVIYTTPEPTDPWTEIGGPCEGSAMASLVFDGAGSAWAACEPDPGLWFALPASDWAAVTFFSAITVNDLAIGSDGRILVAGGDPATEAVLWGVDPAAGTSAVGEPLAEYSGVAPFLRIAAGGLVARSDDAVIRLDGASGDYLGISRDDGGNFLEYQHAGYHLEGLDATADAIWGAGEADDGAPVVAVPDVLPESPVVARPPVLAGELSAVAALPSGGAIAVGADDATGHAIVVTCGLQCDQDASWRVHDVDVVDIVYGIDDATRAWDVAFDSTGLHGIVVGVRADGISGWAVTTGDGGVTWSLVADHVFPALTAAWAFDDGSFAVGGGGGAFALSTILP